MAFYLTSNIIIGEDLVKPNKVTWKTDVNTFIDSCSITLPRITYIENTEPNKTKDIQRTKYRFKEGDKVSVSLGYNQKNVKRFEGFVRRVNMGIPVVLECEGYGYQLYDIMFNKTYAKVTVKQLLTDLIQGTDIVLSKEIPDIPLKNVRFKNATGIQVLQWLKKECALSVYFNFNELFVGTMFMKVQDHVKVKIGWNVVKDDDFRQRLVDKNIKIVIREKDQKGEVKKTKSSEKAKTKTETKPRAPRLDRYSNEKAVKIKAGLPSELLRQIADRIQTKENYKGYEGDITLFLEPYVNKGMVMELDGGMYPEKSGNYFVEAISGEFGENGGRQVVTLGFLMQK
ncbi:hypothetical protein HZR00_00750 [Elizabethkingia anophelis]|nr:hypothetical protein [Elizabethkingia anophelis]